MSSRSHDSGSPLPTLRVGGLRTAQVSRDALASLMATDCEEARKQGEGWSPKLVFSSNGQGIALASRDGDFRKVMSEADIVHADGMPIVFASWLTPRKLPERVATTDFIHEASIVAAREGLRFYFLGASEAQNAAAVRALRTRYPSLKVAGRHHGYFQASESKAICKKVRDAKTDVLWVALGKPQQELWCTEMRDHLRGVGWIKTCGGLYAFLAGESPRAPRWMQSLGLEWLHRLSADPVRLARRYLTTNPVALIRIIRDTDWRARETFSTTPRPLEGDPCTP